MPEQEWISPDIAYGWPDAEKVIDGDPETSIGQYIRYECTTPWLDLRLDTPIEASAVRVLANTVGLDTKITVEVHREGEWVRVYHGGFDNERLTFEFEPGMVDAVRLRARTHEYMRRANVTVWEVDLWGAPTPPPPFMPAWGLCDFFYDVHDLLSHLAGTIHGIWLIGEYLSWPFFQLADLFYEGALSCVELFENLRSLLDAVGGVLTPSAFISLIQQHFPTLYLLVTDPVGWFLVQLTLAFDLEPWHTQSLDFLVKWIMEEYFPTLYHIWLDPDAWIAEHILPLIPALPEWLADPLGWLRDALRDHFPTLYEIAEDPAGWFEARLRELIGQLLEDITEFLDNTWDWLLDRFEDAFEGISDRLYALAERVLRYFWEGVWQES